MFGALMGWCFTGLFAFVVLSVIEPVIAQTPSSTGPAPGIPTVALANVPPVRIEDVDKILRARMAATAQPGTTAATTLNIAANVASGCGVSSSQPVEIATLAASLKCDPDLIFEYVYNNIEFEPLFGSNKGALGTLLDQRGDDIDQAQLFVALLNAVGFSTTQTSFFIGNIRLNGAQASGWLGVKNDAQSIANVFANGGIPIANATANPDGTLASIDVTHVWVQVQINGTNFAFDPSFKLHSVSSGLAALGTVLGYTQTQFLADAGGTIDAVSISNLNRKNIRNDLVTYAGNLANFIRTNNPGAGVSDIVGGKTIQPLTGSPLRNITLPNLSPSQPSGFPQNWGPAVADAYRTCFSISMPGVTPTSCTSPSSQTIALFADQTYGHRITVFSVPSGSNFVPTLLIDGALPPNGQNTGTAASSGSWAINVAISHPYTGSLASAANQSGPLTVSVGGSYLISAGWGQVNRGTIEKHRKLLAQAIAAGNSMSSEPVLGESLAIISYNWLAERADHLRLGDQITKLTTQYHHGLGITAQAAIQSTGDQGPYVDLPFNFDTIQPQTHFTGTGFPPSVIASSFASSGMASSLESAVLEQTQALVSGMQAASTIRLVDINAATGAKTYFADGTSAAGLQAYFANIQPNLMPNGYQASDINFINSAISTTGTSSGQPTGKQVLLPIAGSINVGKWSGAGYTVSLINQSGGSISITQKISGGLSGGFSGENVPPAMVAESTVSQIQPTSANPEIPAGAIAKPAAPADPIVAEPVDAITGAYQYQHTDLVTGSGSTPYALSFGRTYSSASNTSDVGLGKGWSHTYDVTVSRSSDPYAGLGESSPISAAAAIAATFVSQDLLSGTLDAQRMTVAWVVSRWLTDQLTNNSVTVTWPGTNEQFIALPHSDAAASVTYDPPLGSAVVLTGSAPDSFGNFTTFTYTNKDRTQLAFNPLNSSLTGSIASWSFPTGMSLGFAYNASGLLTGVTNTLGRSLTLGYTGNHLTSVTDDTGRSVLYGYDANSNLVSYADPLSFKTTFSYDGASHLTQIFYPSHPNIAFVSNLYDGLGRVIQQMNANGNATSFLIAGSRTEVIDPAGDRHVTYQTPRGKVLKDVSVLSASFGDVFNDTAQQNGIVNVASSQYDGQDRLVLATAPEGGTVAYTYSTDLLHNIVQIARTPKPGSPLSPLVTRFTYDPVFNTPTTITDPLGLVTRRAYDPATGNLLAVTADAGGSPHLNAMTQFNYNGVGQMLMATDPRGIVTLVQYDGKGNPVSVTRDFGGVGHINQRSTIAYDALGNAIAATDPNGNVTTSSFDANRRLAATTSPGTAPAPRGVVTSFAYDPDGRLVQTQQSANGAVLRTSSTAYTLTGQPASATDANGNTTTFAYDAVDRLSRVTDAMGRVTQIGYDALSRPVQVSNAAISTQPLEQRNYTPDGLLASLTDANLHATGFANDGFDRLATTTYPDASTEVLGYDGNGNVLTRQTRKGDTITLSYDTLNRLTSKVAPGEVPVTYTYDLNSQLTSASDTSTAITTPAAGTALSFASSLGYDALNRPLAVSWSPAPAVVIPPASTSVSFAHGYDRTDRRVSQAASDTSWWSVPGSVTSVNYSANNLNQYTAVGAVSPSYDSNGNLTSDGTFTYGYDAESRLTSISQGATSVATYAYDAQGRRKSKSSGGTTTIFATDADNREVVEYDGTSGQVQRWYAYGLGPDTVLNQMSMPVNTRATLIPDIQGSLLATLDTGTGVLSKQGYQAYGESTVTTDGFRYTGRRLDPETAGSAAQPSGLYYYRARMYSPAIGRFLQPDPIGYAGGNNLYAYVGNDPLNNTDPSGRCVEDLCVAEAALLSGAIGGVAGGISGGLAGYHATGSLYGTLVGAGAGLTTGAAIGLGSPFLVSAASAGGGAAAAIAVAGLSGASGAAGAFVADTAVQAAVPGAKVDRSRDVRNGLLIGLGAAIPEATAVGLAGESLGLTGGSILTAHTAAIATVGAVGTTCELGSGCGPEPNPLVGNSGPANPPTGPSK